MRSSTQLPELKLSLALSPFTRSIIHPAIADQTFQGLIAFITLQLPNATARATSHAASLVPTSSYRVLELEQALATDNAIIATNAANAINVTSNPRPSKSTPKANP